MKRTKTLTGLSPGTYALQVRARDGSGNQSLATFRWTVLSAKEGAQNQIGDIQSLVDRGILKTGQGNALIAKLQAAINQMNIGNLTPACNQLSAFIKQVKALILAGTLQSPGEGQDLLIAATRIRSAAGCP